MTHPKLSVLTRAWLASSKMEAQTGYRPARLEVGGGLVPFTVWFSGFEVRCDSPDDVVRLIREAHASTELVRDENLQPEEPPDAGGASQPSMGNGQ